MRNTIKALLLLLIVLMPNILKAQVTLNDFEDAQIYFKGLFYEPSTIDEYGNVEIDMGSASAGRVKFRITDVGIEMREEPEKPGCADICPPRVIITFTCKKSVCVSDPAYESGNYESGVITIENIKKGKKAFDFLNSFKKLIKETE